MPKLSRCATSCAWRGFSLGTLPRYLLEQAYGSVHRTTVRERLRHIRLQQDQVRSCGCLLVVLAPYAAPQSGEIVLGTEIVTASLRHLVPHIVSAPGASPAARFVIRIRPSRTACATNSTRCRAERLIVISRSSSWE